MHISVSFSGLHLVCSLVVDKLWTFSCTNAHLLEGNVGVHFPSFPSGAKRFDQDQRGTGGDRSSRAVVAKKSLVTLPSGIERTATKGASIAQETAVAA